MINFFRVLPTDARYKELTEETKIFLFEMMLSSPTEDEIRKAYRKQQQAETMKIDDEKVKGEMAAAGIDADAINAAIDSGEFVKANA